MKTFHVYVSSGEQVAYEVKAESKIDAINIVRTLLSEGHIDELEVVDRIPRPGFELEEVLTIEGG